MSDLDTMKITAKKLPEPSRRGRVERQESRCRRHGFANVWLTGTVRRREKGDGTGREERREAGRPDVVSAERREEGRKGDTKRGTMTKTRGERNRWRDGRKGGEDWKDQGAR